MQLLNAPVGILVTFFILLFVYTRFLGPIPFSVNSVSTNKSDTFMVTGTGKVTTKPDVAYLTAGVSVQGATVKAAQDQLNSSINKVSVAIKAQGVDSKDIQTTNYSINPNYDYTGGSQRITHYTASSNLSIKIKDLDKANRVIDATTTNGANEVGGLSFQVEDPTKAENEAREKAVAEAKQKAEDAAKIAGFRLGKIINYSEGFNNPGPIPMRAVETLDAKTVFPPTQVEPGSSEVVVTVTLSYQII